jgi:hypothetical protein
MATKMQRAGAIGKREGRGADVVRGRAAGGKKFLLRYKTGFGL